MVKEKSADESVTIELAFVNILKFVLAQVRLKSFNQNIAFDLFWKIKSMNPAICKSCDERLTTNKSSLKIFSSFSNLLWENIYGFLAFPVKFVKVTIFLFVTEKLLCWSFF